MSNLAPLALEANPRDEAHHAKHGMNLENQMMHAAHDPSITFEEYVYYAKITRAEEKESNQRYVEAAGPKTFKNAIKNRFSKEQNNISPPHTTIGYGSPKDHDSSHEKTGSDTQGISSPTNSRYGVSDAEWKNASRATRTAGWSGIFYLITTDILGPYSVP